MGEIINGFDLIEPLQSKNAGFSRWTFAKRGDRVFFLKEFLDPVYPVDAVIGEKQMKARVMACRDFEKKCMDRYQALNDASDGNAVRVEAFFRSGSHYYVAMERVEAERLSVQEISRLPLDKKVNLCRIIAHSFMMLHKNHIVHADVKEQNILVKKTKKNSLTAKIVDFDCSFVEKRPPETEDELNGDQVYFSPEACLFLCGEEARLTSKLDVFALGILFHQYLTGELPGFNTSEYDYLHEAVLDDQPARISPQIMEPFRTMITRMLLADPDQRCSMEDVWNILMPLPCKKYMEAKNRRSDSLDSEPAEITRGGFMYAGDSAFM